MDSVNQQQQAQEDTIKDLAGSEAIKKVKDIAEKAGTCFLCTNIKTGIPVSVKPMSVQEVDEEGNVWFMSVKDSQHNAEIQQDPFVHLLFQESSYAGFLNIYGLAEIVFDKEKVEKYWSPMIKVWFTEGKDDPRISLIKVVPTQGHYWDNKHGAVVSFLKMAASVVIGKTMDDSVEGKLDL